MKKFKFTIKKVLENQVEVKAENRQEALENIIELLNEKGKCLFENSDKNKQIYEIKLDKILNNFEEKIEKNKREAEQELEKIINKIIEQIKEDIVEGYLESCAGEEDELEENYKEIEDDLPKEYSEIICEKCGNCIILDKDLLS